jgi:SagB-type dehydrogenase family enzyme
MPTDPVATALEYHQRTRHSPHAFARSAAYLDWDTQPDPFRRYVGAEVVLLDRAPGGVDPRYDAVLDGALPSPAPTDWEAVSRLFLDALALSAWKEAGDARWSLRVNPSSGNLHPTEAYLVCGAVAGLADAPGVYHYNPYLHGLERRAALPVPTWSRLAADLPDGAVIVGLTSIVWRESWKYGERAFRYCQHDLGHAIGALSLAAGGLGWTARVLDSVPDAAVGALLGVATQAGIEAEVPECLVAIYPADRAFPLPQWRHFRAPPLPPLTWCGTPNALSPEHQEWPVLGIVEEATRSEGPGTSWAPASSREGRLADRPVALRAVLRQRRSAVEMDGQTPLGRDAFFRTLCRLLPGAPPFDALPWAPAVHLALFVHRVEGLTPGLYALARDPAALPALRTALSPRFRWEPVEGGPAGLHLLDPTDVRGLAGHVSCGQAIAGDGAFAVAMLADLPGCLARHGAAFYRRIHWEAGAIGQVLYLEAETDGLRGTGIGCFYDDATRNALGIVPPSGWATMYHFTVGGAVDDPRLRTLDPSAHLEG